MKKVIKMVQPHYQSKVQVHLPLKIKQATYDYGRQKGVRMAVVIRWALVDYLKEKGVLNKNTPYL